MGIVPDELSKAHAWMLHVNDFRMEYADVKDFIERNEEMAAIEDDDWATTTSRDRALQTETLVELRWYPKTPVGFCLIYGATVEEVLAAAKAGRWPMDPPDHDPRCEHGMFYSGAGACPMCGGGAEP